MSPLALSHFWPAEFLPARRGQESAGRRTAQRAIPTTVAGGKDAAKGSLGWTNGANGVAWKNPKGISSFSPALTRSGYAG
jgi:hypothetical protein